MTESTKLLDDSIIRKKANENNQPVVEFIVDSLKVISKKENQCYTLLAVCPNSENVLIAALRAAKRANSPIMFAATLNQVDIDGGYTGWKQEDLAKILRQESYKIGYDGPIILCVDHGGPWVKDIQSIEKWDLNRSMNWVKKSFEASVTAGYDLIHVDPTTDLFKKSIEIETVVERTIELIQHIEDFREKQKKSPISYEVGTEEVHGGLANLDIFKKFLKQLKKGLKNVNLEVWPIFIVAKVGTDLHTSEFNFNIARNVSTIVKDYNSLIKAHYTDFVSNLKDYPRSGVGAANVGPEFTIAEYEAFEELERIEIIYFKKDKIARLSGLMKKIEEKVLDSGRWKKWLLCGERDYYSLPQNRKNWILKTSSRYIWTDPEVRCAIYRLHENLETNGFMSKDFVVSKIESIMDKYFREFNLIDLNGKLKKLVVPES